MGLRGREKIYGQELPEREIESSASFGQREYKVAEAPKEKSEGMAMIIENAK